MVRTFTLLLATCVLFVTNALAQDNATRMETFLGYTFTRFNAATDVPAFSSNGGSAQFVYNFNNWIGAVADVGAVHNGNISDINLDSTITNYLFGPRVTFRHWARITPYFQILFGGVYATTSTGVLVPADVAVPGFLQTTQNPDFVILRAARSQTAFAMTVGGGVDFKLNRHVSFRPVQLEYFLTRLQNLRSEDDNNQNNLRYSTGFNFTFGGER
jgi:opacity protein-like surface antigen